MPSDKEVETFLKAMTEKRLQMALDAGIAPKLRTYFGQGAYDEYVKMAERVRTSLAGPERALGLKAPKNLIFVPGVMGSLLLSDQKGGVWWIDVRTREHIDDLRLDPEGAHSADPTNDLSPCTTDPSYEPFFAALLARNDFGHVAFPYDWRKPITAGAEALKNRILELHQTNGATPVHLVAHSMGGLLVRATLMLHGPEVWPRLGRIAFIATPHYGSPAIAGYLKNHLWGFDVMALLGIYLSRPTLRSLWGVLAMLPAPRGIYPGTRTADPHPWSSPDPDDPYVHPCANFDMYRVDNWVLDLAPGERQRLQNVLDGAAVFHKRMYEAHQALDQELRDRMAVVAGVGFKTLFRLSYARRFFGLWERMDKVLDRIDGDLHREGDSRVPLASACLENVREIRYVRGVHGSLPMMPQVYDDVFRWLNGEPMVLPDNPAGALRKHLAEAPRSEFPHLDGSVTASGTQDDPGLWNTVAPDTARLAALRDDLDQDKIPEFSRVHLL